MSVTAVWLARGSSTQVVECLGDDNVDAAVGTLDVAGWSWLLVAVCDEQTDACSESSCNSD